MKNQPRSVCIKTKKHQYMSQIFITFVHILWKNIWKKFMGKGSLNTRNWLKNTETSVGKLYL